MTTILAAGGLCPPGPPTPGWVAIDDGRIVDLGWGVPPAAATDLDDAVLAPAFVDLQVNGIGATDLAEADPAGYATVGATLARHGVGAYLATFVSAPLDTYRPILRRLTAAQATRAPDAAVALGAHLEGPFLGGRPGAHPPALLRTVDLAWLERLVADHPEQLRMVTLAPEADPAFRAVALLARHGILVALGHSTATADTARDAADAGARAVTHLYNAMSPLRHRDPGLVGAALDDPRLTPTLIADLVHVDPTAVRVALRSRPDLALISDAVATTGLADVDGAARQPDGRLAGATALLDDGVANLVAVGLPLEQAVHAASTAPAALLGLPDRGRVAVGARADLVALDPQSGTLRRTWLDGHPLD